MVEARASGLASVMTRRDWATIRRNRGRLRPVRGCSSGAFSSFVPFVAPLTDIFAPAAIIGRESRL
jgi:hypothetical protein